MCVEWCQSGGHSGSHPLLHPPCLPPPCPPPPCPQDKLHTTLCRQRSLVAIGTHDLATITGPFTYEALPPADISFVPLKQTRSFRADELMQVGWSGWGGGRAPGGGHGGMWMF